jgi:hypothetical protein
LGRRWSSGGRRLICDPARFLTCRRRRCSLFPSLDLGLHIRHGRRGRGRCRCATARSSSASRSPRSPSQSPRPCAGAAVRPCLGSVGGDPRP